MKSVHFFTQAEASALVAKVEPLVRRLREAHQRYVSCAQNLEDLTIVHGEAVRGLGHEAHDEWRRYASEFELLSAEIRGLVDDIQTFGAQVKDPGIGLLDFYAKRGEEVVFLCWQLGEEKVEHWHALGEGFLGRKPVLRVYSR